MLIYAAEARAYALVALLVFCLFLLVAEDTSRAGTVGVALLAAAAMYTHYLALFAIAVLLGQAAWRRRGRAAAGLVAGCALFLPWVPVLRVQPRAATGWIRESAAESAVGFLAALGGAARVTPALGGPLPRGLLLAGVAAAIVLGWSLLRRRKDPAVRGALFFVGCTLGAVLLVSPWRHAAFAGRTELVVLPVWIWAVARAAEAGRLARIAAAFAAAVGVLSSALILRAQSRSASAYDPAVAAAGRLARPGDLLIAAGPFYLPARLASERGRITATLAAFPADLADHPGWLPPTPPAARDHEAMRRAADACSTGCRVLLLGFAAPRPPGIEAILARRGVPRPLWRGGLAEITLWGDSPLPP